MLRFRRNPYKRTNLSPLTPINTKGRPENLASLLC